jgi:hypothetical protein
MNLFDMMRLWKIPFLLPFIIGRYPRRPSHEVTTILHGPRNIASILVEFVVKVGSQAHARIVVGVLPKNCSIGKNTPKEIACKVVQPVPSRCWAGIVSDNESSLVSVD